LRAMREKMNRKLAEAMNRGLPVYRALDAIEAECVSMRKICDAIEAADVPDESMDDVKGVAV